jgi:DNA-binding SARP family transcriptional activator/tetratricopeptide (TPR) repeat protein
MRFRLLGPIQVEHAGCLVALPRRHERCLLAALLLHTGQMVPMARLIRLLWDEDPPARAEAVVHTYISRLRATLATAADRDVRLERRGAGYALVAAPDTVDALQFRALLSEARGAGDPAERADLLRRGLDLWRGPALADLAEGQRQRLAAGLEELRQAALDLRIEADLELGRHDELLPELTELTARHPLSERLTRQLMVALARSGRVADALSACRGLKARLAAELGVDPGAELQELELKILRGDVDRAASPPPPRSAPSQLPLRVQGFAGRDRELSWLDATLGGTDERSTAVPVAVLSGPPGVGKTALAVYWARRVAGGYPGGQLYANLRGFDPGGTPARPADVLHGFLDSLGVPARRIPAGLDARSALYRSQLTGRRTLVVLDNARDAEQVRPLLPGAPGCTALVTSRAQLSGLVAAEGAHPLVVPLLTDAEAHALLANRLGRARLAAEPEATGDLVALCARLPIALSVAAARAAATPTLPLAALAAELRDARDRLDALAIPGDAATDVRAVFSWSYQAVSPPAARLFRLLSVHPGPDLGAAAAASLAGEPVETARASLAELAGANLIAESRPGRYGFHDLLRAYATELSERAEGGSGRRGALAHLTVHYAHTALAADRVLYPHREAIGIDPPDPRVVVGAFAEPGPALEWLVAEETALLATVPMAAAAGLDRLAFVLAWTLENYLDWRGRWPELAETQAAGLAAAQRSGDRVGVADAHSGLARAYTRLGRSDHAKDHLLRALVILHETGDHVRAAHTHMHLNVVLTRQERHEEALAHARRSLEVFERLGDLPGQARARNGMGWSEAQLGRYDAAAEHCATALEIQRKVGDRPGEAASWDSLGYIAQHQGRHGRAVECYERAAELRRILGNRSQQASTLSALGHAHLAAGDRERARAAWAQAVSIMDDIGSSDAADVRADLDRLDAQP